MAMVLHVISPQMRVMYRKNKKIHFSDPAIYRAFGSYTGIEVLDETLAESVAVSHLARVCDVYFWRNSSEVDAVAVLNREQIGFEVKWGVKAWKKPRHLRRAFLLDRNELPLFLA